MRTALASIAAFVVGLAAGWVARDRTQEPPPPPATSAAERPALDTLAATIRRLRGRFEQLREPTAEEEARLRRPRTPSYSRHLDRADALGVPPLSGEGELARHLAAGRLVPLVDTEHYVVRVLEHSKPFVTPLLRERLAEVGQRFQARLAEAGLPAYRLTVSSALRTSSLQRALGESNQNAAVGRSSHEYGASADLVYFRFAGPGAPDPLRTPPADPARALAVRWTDDLAGTYDDRLFGVLARILHEMQQEGRLLVLLEDEQPVFHVTTDGS